MGRQGSIGWIYYMSCNAELDCCRATTLTGSIGIFGNDTRPQSVFTQKLGIKFDEVKRTRIPRWVDWSARPMNEEEIGYLQNYIIHGYSLFRQRVADGRKLQVNDVEKDWDKDMFLGQDAMKIKLVDQLGGLDVAVAKAAKLAKMKEYYTCSYPEQTDWLSQLMSASSNSNYLDEQMRAAMVNIITVYVAQTDESTGRYSGSYRSF